MARHVVDFRFWCDHQSTHQNLAKTSVFLGEIWRSDMNTLLRMCSHDGMSLPPKSGIVYPKMEVQWFKSSVGFGSLFNLLLSLL